MKRSTWPLMVVILLQTYHVRIISLADAAPTRRSTSISATAAQPDLRDRVHTLWMHGPTYPSKPKMSGTTWPSFGTGSVKSSGTCDPTRQGFTGYEGSTATSGYCSPASSGFKDDPAHLLIHSGRLAVVLDAAASSGLIAKLGVVSETNATSSAGVYNSLSAASLNVTLDVRKETDTPQPQTQNCASDHGNANSPCRDAAFPTCKGFVTNSAWGTCWGTQFESGSFSLAIDNTNAQVQLVRQGHAVAHILATNLNWDVPLEQCSDEKEPSGTRSGRGAQNCLQNYGGSHAKACTVDYTECRGFIQGKSWGTCWKPCIPGGTHFLSHEAQFSHPY